MNWICFACYRLYYTLLLHTHLILHARFPGLWTLAITTVYSVFWINNNDAMCYKRDRRGKPSRASIYVICTPPQLLYIRSTDTLPPHCIHSQLHHEHERVLHFALPSPNRPSSIRPQATLYCCRTAHSIIRHGHFPSEWSKEGAEWRGRASKNKRRLFSPTCRSIPTTAVLVLIQIFRQNGGCCYIIPIPCCC